MTFLRAWGAIIVVTVWLASLILGVAALVTTVPCFVAFIFAGRVYLREMHEWRIYGHPRSRRRGA